MPRNLSPRTQAIQAAKAKIGEILTGYAKSKDPSQAPTTKEQVLQVMAGVLMTPEAATAKYRQRCESYLERVIAVRGIPFVAVVGSGEGQPVHSCSGEWVADNFDLLLPEIRQQLDASVGRFFSYAETVFAHYEADFLSLLDDFLSDPPRLAKEIGPRVTPVKRELGYYTKWDRLLGVLTSFAFLNEVEYIFHRREGRYIAVEWRYSEADKQMDFASESDHPTRDGAIYAVRDNWAIQKGMIVPGSVGYIDDTDIPGRQLGCMCDLRWISSLDELPEDMLTDAGREAVRISKEQFRQFMTGGWEKQSQSWIARMVAKIFGKKPD
ncbi:hypothetical protein [Acidithiobacillus caldus]|uniref:hypothetical protein n=1 Tax=Acidithiobacillus caldus TaxID=33059 RepID=UPI00057068BF|nr:hypothetical protein [Acidithiobacillus caldus]MBU2731182.1 hypothetical protein [Acidithiobacillus caldus]MBU2734414.1 hypothetical protein [Acidithiobacillus caldus ATCC 51756]MBU2744724.1 hypothetical protein [Acidithiobacillus caldus]MBU2779160.1 hypothetical protein [Acidithiobacillus caldus]